MSRVEERARERLEHLEWAIAWVRRSGIGGGVLGRLEGERDGLYEVLGMDGGREGVPSREAGAATMCGLPPDPAPRSTVLTDLEAVDSDPRECWEVRGAPSKGLQGWVSNRGRSALLDAGTRPARTIYGGAPPEPAEKPPKPFTLGEKLRARRRELGILQRDLAHRAGLAYPSLVSNIERGVRRVTPEELASIARVLDLRPEELEP